MKSIIRWAVRNGPGINVLIVVLLGLGFASFMSMRREIFPEFQLDVVLVTVPYPGASPDEVESGISSKIEEEIQSITGIKRITSIAREGAGYTLAELTNAAEPDRVLSEIRSAVDRIGPQFPQNAERATVEQITFRQPAINVAIIGPDDRSPAAERRLREIAEDVRTRLLDLPTISQAELINTKPFQIDVELAEDTLRKYGLSINQVAAALRSENQELPGGQIKTEGQEILLRGKNKRDTGEAIESLPVISQPNGTVLTIGDLGTVRDHFDDVTALNEVNGHPAQVIKIDRSSDEDLLALTDDVHEFVRQTTMPPGYRILAANDESVDVRDRIRMLRDNGIQGGLIVFVMLAIFLNPRLAFWVAMGIPISIFGAGIVLVLFGQTLNMLSMFAFLMAVGIVVDDGIVIGENIYEHRLLGKSYLQASIDGASEVLPSVFSSIGTTIVAFLPLLFVSGVMGKFIAVMPLAIIAMLLISLAEVTFALPGHLSHEPGKAKTSMQKTLALLATPLLPLEKAFQVMGRWADSGFEWFNDYVYSPSLRAVLRYPQIPIGAALLMVLSAAGLVRSGTVPFEFFPKLDGKNIVAQIVYPSGTPASVTAEAVRRIDTAVREISQDVAAREEAAGTNLTPPPESPDSVAGPVKLTLLQVGFSSGDGSPAASATSSGSNVGQVQAELHDASMRNLTSEEIIALWRERAGEFPGAERVTFQSANMGPGGKALEFKILAPASSQEQLEAAVERCKQTLAKYEGVFDIRDDNVPGKYEFQFRVKESAQSLGVSQNDLAEAIRSSYYGAEVMRLQRGRHEVKLMVRYPEEQRGSLADFENIRVRGADGVERPFLELADVTVSRGYNEINRLDQYRSITISADVDVRKANAYAIAQELQEGIVPTLMAQYPTLRFRWEGQQQETAESFQSLLIGFIAAMLGMYFLLVLEFRSYLQPMLVLLIVPFGLVGAVYGHAIMNLPLTLFSMFGMVTLSGVVVNDSIVMIDFINRLVRGGEPLKAALEQAGRRRLRAVMLTSITTIAGLLPMLLEKSFQAQALVPMATSLAFGLMATTLLVLFLMPFLYQNYAAFIALFAYDVAVDPTQWVEDDGKEKLPATA